MLRFIVISALMISSVLQSSSILAQTLSIREAKTRPFGTVVTIAGRVTVANEFGGPAYMQDGTAGIAVFDTTLHRAVQIGDSIEVTGPLSEFQATTNQPGTGLTQISGAGTTVAGAAMTRWRRFDVPSVVPVPRVVTVSEVTEAVEGQLIRLNDVTFQTMGVFQGNQNYQIRDARAMTEIRINARTNLVGLRIPTGNQSVVGVLSQFRGGYQVLPRFAGDLGLQVTINPADTVPKSRTFDMTTWNVRWFGVPRDMNGVALGPADSLLQFRNVVRVLDSIDADIVAVQEIANAPLFQQISDALPRYGTVIAFGIQPPNPAFVPQRTGFLYKRSVVDTLRTQLLTLNSRFAGGRFPFLLEFNATVQGARRRMNAIVIHAKAGATEDDYQQRLDDARVLYEAMNAELVNQNTVLLGDFNDDLTRSIVGGRPTPYQLFTQDTMRYLAVTASLSRQGLSSQSRGSMIDNIIVTAPLRSAVLQGGEKLENPSYISSYFSTTSDHYPVSARLLLDRATSSVEARAWQPAARSVSTSLQGFRVLPSVVSDRMTIEFVLPAPMLTQMEIVDALGRTVWREAASILPQGTVVVSADLQQMPSGVYWCRVQTQSGVQAYMFCVQH
jgi:endonuclease/exonuclease/phosphatase family metal-dependent hydrolase